ncbi:hypothetical protein OKJ48_00270 [Streptomyces kunmingensis]|uniref:Response regulatory domain-containing protein n=1 Tax=Streptomyces kunmingensis TaxID=68225 RepID=A0ABU6C4E1_9ACTN|nr:hypothetical protein [Streptomyces kunmingensis]MEB3958700.1 hypothetical protein [Streptomyces kunmingensis]
MATTFDLEDYVFGTLEAGAVGFLLKDAAPDDLVDAVRRPTDDHGLLDQAVAGRVIAEFARRRTPLGDGPHTLGRRAAPARPRAHRPWIRGAPTAVDENGTGRRAQ